MFFQKKIADTAAMNAFWSWFSENEGWIIENIKTNGMLVVSRIDQVLTPVFPYFKKEIEFQLGFNNGKGEFFFFDLNNKYLRRDGLLLGEKMPEGLRQNWQFIVEH